MEWNLVSPGVEEVVPDLELELSAWISHVVCSTTGLFGDISIISTGQCIGLCNHTMNSLESTWAMTHIQNEAYSHQWFLVLRLLSKQEVI